MSECNHKFQMNGYSGRGSGRGKVKIGDKLLPAVPLTFTFRCSLCHSSIQRPASPGERKVFAKLDRRNEYGGKKRNIHTVWHEFRSLFMTGNGDFKSRGYELMCQVEEWAKKYPRDVRLCAVDDSYHAGSTLALIEHQTNKRYMGTTAVVIPQCTGEAPIAFFLYPDHRNYLMRALFAIDRVSKIRKQREREETIKRDALTKKFIRHPAVL